ncbi:hypothetical protein Dpoa2040_003289 [Dickeya sp. CFBP 2040]|uniref:hypothetical protein n=1 Tax=Dickeya sp. CFBP 2040 TaxID=2718531 RepID=UPI0014483D03|nr:hypothetical protein [Dickeya sp. CFBP 2040]NKI75961.1 hypothetical protein [Dickeya sp. CFBP 2040]
MMHYPLSLEYLGIILLVAGGVFLSYLSTETGIIKFSASLALSKIFLNTRIVADQANVFLCGNRMGSLFEVKINVGQLADNKKQIYLIE